ncbi:protein FAF-like, chloroplastic [Ricinus communis]|uniref:protein FAF-like, chloroplastic n=1 Tax=Ricinus communis TaxID=3988 RepID=UPI00201A87ED|nr:protein FAF-like, chloroplastic [Ricinus communis]
MAACGSLQHIFEKPLPETPTLLESLSSWNPIKTIKPIEQSSFTEIFGELHFKENSESSSSSPSFPIPSFYSSSPSSSFIGLIPEAETSNLNRNDSFDSGCHTKKSTSLDSLLSTPKNYQYAGCHRNGDSFSPRNYESLQLCTEGLGFESFDDVEDLKNDMNENRQHQEEKAGITRHSVLESQAGEIRRSRLRIGAFPPPISCIGKSGKPWVSFKSYRHDGRFVLKQVRIPSQEFLHAHREDGRLKLHFVQPNDGIHEEEEGEEENFTEDDEQEENEEIGNKEVQEQHNALW